ncbi:MAG: DUF5716 family protein [Eubacteriales bacterium]|nr:DUF5716 family protein [Eubacteriales bacterium]
MSLFQIVPEKFFSILACQNQEIYLLALMVLRRCYRQELSIRKSDYIAELAGELSQRSMDLAPEDEGLPEDSSFSGQAHFLLRKLVAAGWVEEETENTSFADTLVIPDYAAKFLNLIHELTTDQHREYNKYVFTTYSVLKNANETRDDYLFDALDFAYRNTAALVDDLKSLLGNIRRYHQLLSSQVDVRGVLSQHFDQFSEQIEKKFYHPIKTFDSVDRFRPGIMAILGDWREDSLLKDQMAELALKRIPGRFPNVLAARGEIQAMIDGIIRYFDYVPELVREIDRKHRRYLVAAYDRIIYLSQSDQTIKGKVARILAALPDLPEEELEDLLAQNLQLFRAGWFSDDDLFTPRKRRQEFAPEPLPVRSQPDMEAIRLELESFADRVRQGFDQKKVLAFMESQFGERTTLTTAQLDIPGMDEFILSLLAVLRHDDPASFYRIELGSGYLINNGFCLPNITFQRKEVSPNGLQD